jgi:hypothetical protein
LRATIRQKPTCLIPGRRRSNGSKSVLRPGNDHYRSIIHTPCLHFILGVDVPTGSRGDPYSRKLCDLFGLQEE